MADRRRRGGSPDTWDGTWEAEILDLIYGYYEVALNALPLEDMPSLASRLLDAGVCIGFADPVINIISNTLSFPEPESTSIKERKRKRKLKTNKGRLREEVLSHIIASGGPSPPESRTVAERSLEGLVSFLTSYFSYLSTGDALRYISLARADLLAAVMLIQKDRCYCRQDQFRLSSPAVRTALKSAALSAMQPAFDCFLVGCFALVSHINKITQILLAQGCCNLTVQDISLLSGLLTNPLKIKGSHKLMNMLGKRVRRAASFDTMPGLTESLRGVLMDRVHKHYLKAVSMFAMKDVKTHHHHAILKAGYCFGPFAPVSNIIINTLWYNWTFPPSETFEVDMICTLRHVESRSVNGLIALLSASFPLISEHEAIVYLLKSNLDVHKAKRMAKLEGCDLAICDDNGYEAAVKAASHPYPEAYCKFVMESLPSVSRSTVRSLLQTSQMLPSSQILNLSTLLSFPSVEILKPTIQLTEDALKRITNYKEDFLTQQSFIKRKVQAALHNYEQSKGCYYDLGLICGINDSVGKEIGIFDSKFQYTHANFWASQNNGTNILFFAEFSNDEDSDYEPFCHPVSGKEIRCCYCEYQGVRILHPNYNRWEGASGFEEMARGESCLTNAEIVSHWKLIDNQVMGIFVQDYIYLDPAKDAKLIQSVNHAERVAKVDLDAEMCKIKSVSAGGHWYNKLDF